MSAGYKDFMFELFDENLVFMEGEMLVFTVVSPVLSRKAMCIDKLNFYIIIIPY